MIKLIALIGIVFLAGCGGPLKISVYGKSGAAFTAPSLCAALVQCMNSNETACFYERELVTNADGSHMEGGCKEVQK